MEKKLVSTSEMHLCRRMRGWRRTCPCVPHRLRVTALDIPSSLHGGGTCTALEYIGVPLSCALVFLSALPTAEPSDGTRGSHHAGAGAPADLNELWSGVPPTPLTTSSVCDGKESPRQETTAQACHAACHESDARSESLCHSARWLRSHMSITVQFYAPKGLQDFQKEPLPDSFSRAGQVNAARIGSTVQTVTD